MKISINIKNSTVTEAKFSLSSMRSDVFTVVKMWIVVSWDMMTLCSRGSYQRLGKTLHLQTSPYKTGLCPYGL
jgi:hypothetical protein